MPKVSSNKKNDTSKKSVEKKAEVSKVDNKKDIEYTKKFSESSKKINNNLNNNKLEKSGVKKSSDGSATVKPYEKKFIPASKNRTSAAIVDGKGNLVKRADTKKGAATGNENLYREYKRDSINTMNRRSNNANFINVNTNKKQVLTKKDLASLSNMKKIKLSS